MKYFYFSTNLNYQDNLLRYKDKSIIIYNDKNFINEKELNKGNNKEQSNYTVKDKKDLITRRASGDKLTREEYYSIEPNEINGYENYLKSFSNIY